MDAPDSFGIVVVGDEILSGKRADRHFPHLVETLGRRGMQLAWSRVVGDDRRRLAHELKLSQQDDVPVFCFGGIGATPDDQTRQAAAEAFGVRLARHPEAAALIESGFGNAAFPDRIRMAELPGDCRLIPNAYNRIPGFTLYDHHFLPGFPRMAWPMVDWVLERYYPLQHVQRQERSLRVFNVAESGLLQMMDELSARHPTVKFFSLPRMAEINSIELGFRGEYDAVEVAFADLLAALTVRRLHFEMPDRAKRTEVVRRAGVRHAARQRVGSPEEVPVERRLRGTSV
ncbi:MAG: molybdopterin-binding protein [Gammaproteobacteria bacterium]